MLIIIIIIVIIIIILSLLLLLLLIFVLNNYCFSGKIKVQQVTLLVILVFLSNPLRWRVKLKSAINWNIFLEKL